MNFIVVVWRCAHTLADNGGGKYAGVTEQRCQRLDAMCTRGFNAVDSLSYVLKEKLYQSQNNDVNGLLFIEFVSNICSGTYGHRTTIDFVWEICCCDGVEIEAKDRVPAEMIIELCIDIAEMTHYMIIDDTSVMKELANNGSRKKAILQSMTYSLLEYARSRSQQDFSYEFGGNTTTNVATITDDTSISKRDFHEWQRKVVPDLLQNSVAQFLQVLLFPPKPDDKNDRSMPMFRRYNRLIPVLHSSKELLPRNAAKLKDGEVVPMKSALFGHNYVEDDTSAGLTGQVATKVFAPEVFAFTAISAAKFGNKWYRVYSGTEDGWTFNQLENSIIGYQGPTLIIIQASSKDHPGKSVTFGAYTAAKWEKKKKDFFGSADCFLFQLEPKLRIMKSLPKMGTRGGHYMYFHSNTNVVSNNLGKKDELVEGFGFGGTTRNLRLFVDRSLEECRVMNQDTTFEEGHLGFPPSSDSMSVNSSTTLQIDFLEIYAVGDDDTIQRGFLALNQYRDIADANLRNARTVDKAAFMGDLRNGVIESKAFAHRGQVDGRAHGSLKGDDGKANGL
eukprot:scaffold64450_cov55-Cyclotella_meneghiniana.AAC.1